MNDYQIVKNAPEGATHYDGTYYRYEAYEHGQAYLIMKNGSWVRGTPSYPHKYVRALDDIRKLCSLYQGFIGLRNEIADACEDVMSDFVKEFFD